MCSRDPVSFVMTLFPVAHHRHRIWTNVRWMQVLVTHDMLGMYEKISPRFVKKYLDGQISDALTKYGQDVRDGKFPNDENSYLMDASELKELQSELDKK